MPELEGGGVMQNVLAFCTFDLQFTYVLSGWEGLASDTTLYVDAHQTDFNIPDGKFYLADAGFSLSKECITPCQGMPYHLQEFGESNIQ
jgi:DDE superfamily endonuclease